MANLIMESFQGVSSIHDIPIFIGLNTSTNYTYFSSGGRDGKRIAVLGSYPHVGYIVSVKSVSKNLYMGFRMYWDKFHSYSSADYMALKANFGSNFIQIKISETNGIQLPDETRFIPSGNFYMEVLVDDIYFEFRMDNKTIYREEHSFSYPTELGIYNNNDGRIGIMDLYFNDSDGNVNNNAFGDVKINAYPITGNGSLNTGFVSNSGGPLYEAVDEIPVDASDWIEAVNIGDQVTFQLADLPTDEAPLAVKISAQASKLAATNSGIKLLSKIGDDIYKSDKLSLPVEGKQAKSLLYNESPAGTPWNSNDLNALEIGMEIVP